MATILTPLKKLLPRRRPIQIKRSTKPYLKEQGWRHTYENGQPQLEGYYRTRYGSFYGRIQNPSSSKPSFYIKNPPKELDKHSHRSCFTDRGNGWYSVHFSTLPRDLDSGVLHIERTLNEAFVLSKKTA